MFQVEVLYLSLQSKLDGAGSKWNRTDLLFYLPVIELE